MYAKNHGTRKKVTKRKRLFSFLVSKLSQINDCFLQPRYNFRDMCENNELRNFNMTTVVSVGGKEKLTHFIRIIYNNWRKSFHFCKCSKSSQPLNNKLFHFFLQIL